MRLIYIDEAGTSANEPVVVVVGIIVHADSQWRVAREAMGRAVAKIPAKFQRGFISHAAAIWGSEKYRPEWTQNDRFAFLCEVMAMPRLIGMSVAYGAIDKRLARGGAPGLPLDVAKQAHLLSFMRCIEAIDGFMQEYAGTLELATVVAEDVPEMRKWLRGAVEALKAGVLEQDGIEATYNPPDGTETKRRLTGMVRVARLVDVTHFAAKSEAPLLQIADACAFGLRRFWADQSSGDKFFSALLGTTKMHERLKKFTTAGMSGVFPMIPAYLMRPDKPLPPIE